MVKYKNKVTGEIIETGATVKDTSRSKEKPQRKTPTERNTAYGKRSAKVEKKIKDRGNFWGDVKKGFESPSGIRKGIAGAQALTSPFRAFEGGNANLALEIQRGNIDVGKATIEESFNRLLPPALVGYRQTQETNKIAKALGQGYSGRKQTEYGDVFRAAGAGEGWSIAGGLALSFLGPVTAIKSASKILRGVTRVSDKGLILAGNRLISGTEKATEHAGSIVNEAYRPVADTIVDTVRANKVAETITELPDVLIKHVNKELGVNILALGDDLTVGMVRKIKGVIGKLKATSFGKDVKGVAETIESSNINKVYASLKGTIREVVENQHGKKVAREILDGDEIFTEVIRAGREIKSKLVSKILQKPTKGGAIAKGLEAEGDTTIRTAISTLRKHGGAARKDINKAIKGLEKFNSWVRRSEIAQHALKAAVYGGAIGGLGATIAGKMYKE